MWLGGSLTRDSSLDQLTVRLLNVISYPMLLNDIYVSKMAVIKNVYYSVSKTEEKVVLSISAFLTCRSYCGRRWVKICNPWHGSRVCQLGYASFKNSSCKPSTSCFNGQVRGMLGSGVPHNCQTVLCLVQGESWLEHPFNGPFSSVSVWTCFEHHFTSRP